jgi:hypothetical protein
MSTRAPRLWTLCLLLPLMAACERFDRSPALARNGTALESPRAGDREKARLVTRDSFERLIPIDR